MSCDWCKKPIEDGAKVCAECGRRQGLMGMIVSVSTLVGVAIALLGAALSSYQALQTALTADNVSAALVQAQDASKAATSALVKAQAAADSSLEVEKNIKAITKDLVAMQMMVLADSSDAMMANRQLCPPENCPALEKVIRQLDRYYEHIISQNRPYLTDKVKIKLDKRWCGTVARIFYYYKSRESINILANEFIEHCEEWYSKSVSDVKKQMEN